jgi:Uma2 family endonuclease
MAVETRLMTADELLALPHGWGKRYELVRGELITMSPAGLDHGIIGSRIEMSLSVYVHAQKLGITPIASTGYLLERNPDTVHEPDVSFVAAARVVRTPKYFPGPPDLAVEVISPSDTYGEVQDKVDRYIAAGTRMVIVINPRNQTATVTTPAAVKHLTVDDTLDGGEVVPGWTLPLRDLFAD